MCGCNYLIRIDLLYKISLLFITDLDSNQEFIFLATLLLFILKSTLKLFRIEFGIDDGFSFYIIYFILQIQSFFHPRFRSITINPTNTLFPSDRI